MTITKEQVLIPHKLLEYLTIYFEGNAEFKDELDAAKELRTLLNAGKSAMSEPVAVRHSFDGYGWMFTDNGDGSSWLENGMKMPDAELLYTTPPAEAKQPLTNEQIITAMCEDGCERIENFYHVGPVQKAAVWSFAQAIHNIGAKEQ